MGPIERDPTPELTPTPSPSRDASPTPTSRSRIRLALLTAAVLTLLTTWAPPLLSRYTRGDLHVAYETSRLDPALYADNTIFPPTDWTIRTWHWSAGPGLRSDLFSECLWMGSTLGSSQSTQPNRTRTVVSSGWPLRIAEFTEFDPHMPSNLASHPLAWFRYGVPISYQRRLPLRVHPFALAINLAFWTVVALISIAAVTHLRSSRRRRRGHCTACAYPLCGVPICPECGAPAHRAIAPLTRG